MQADSAAQRNAFLKAPWRDAAGRLSAFKIAVFVALFGPVVRIGWLVATSSLGPRPVHAVVLETGLWTIRLLFISLAISPARTVLDWPRLLEVRRMIGVAAFAYGAAHITLYTADEMWNIVKVASEIVLRIYLTIGFAALLGLAALAATSTDAMMRRMGPSWARLHRWIYVIAVLAAVHFFLQSKADVAEPMMMMGFYAWLMGWRYLARRRSKSGSKGQKRRRPGLGLGGLAILGIAAVLATALGEAGYFALKMHVDPLRILAVNFAAAGFRPAWGGGIAVLACLVLALALPPLRGRRAGRTDRAGLKQPAESG